LIYLLLFVEQSLAERAQAQTGLLWEEANAHAEAAAAREGKLQAEVAVACEIQCVKEAMARQAHKDATDLKNKLEDAEQKAKDAASDLQAVVEGKSLIIAQELTPCACVWSSSLFSNLESLQALESPRRPSRRSWS
jgi:hypothetical protein